MAHILTLDQGTTSTRAMIFDDRYRLKGMSQIELTQHFPASGWVEHDAMEIWRAALQTAREAMDQSGGIGRIEALGLTNQRETAVLWDRSTGEALHRAIVWQDRRTTPECQRLHREGHEAEVSARTGLLLDPYFSATKFAWLLDHVPGARARAEAGTVCLGTIDSWLIYNLTGGRRFVTDATNAARTSLMDLRTLEWDAELCALFRVPMSALATILPCAGAFGETRADLFGRALPITGCAGDQHAALIGHNALQAGEAKVTYGTGAFLVAHVGPSPVASSSRLLSTLGYEAGERAYALEGSIFSAGSTIQWLRDALGLIGQSRETEALAQSLKDNDGVYLVPGFTGLGAPWWQPQARACVTGMSRDTGPAHLVRAGLEAMAYQTADLIEALSRDGAPALSRLRVDGGVTANGFAMQHLADVCGLCVERPAFQEATALGAAKLAALGAGLSERLDHTPEDESVVFEPRMDNQERARLKQGWRRAVRSAIIAAGIDEPDE